MISNTCSVYLLQTFGRQEKPNVYGGTNIGKSNKRNDEKKRIIKSESHSQDEQARFQTKECGKI